MPDIGTRRELFVDRFLVEKLDGVRLKMHHPRLTPLEPSQPSGGYATVIVDGGSFRRYDRDSLPDYVGEHFDRNPGEITRYYESEDGIHWTRPNLGIHKLGAGVGDNVILAGVAPLSHNFSPFLDRRPDVAKADRYKALAGVHKRGGLVALVSGDGVHWKKLRQEPVITSHDFAFDSQNVSFWSQRENQYVCYFRTWQTSHGRLRTMSRATSDDYVHWNEAVPMHPNVADEHLYTSGTHPYFRAPHIDIALPTRFHPQRGGSTDIMFMTTRGRPRYERTFMEAFIRPGLNPSRWGDRANYAALNVVPTGPEEMSIYVKNRRYVLRTDGFASIHAPHDGGRMLTKPFTFAGKRLEINYSTSAAGGIQVEIQDVDGTPLPGYSREDCREIIGDEIQHVVTWKAGPDVEALSDRPIRLLFSMIDADLYSIRFR